MPRIMAPPPSGEFNVVLAKPFEGKPTHTVQITGEPNRPATITTSADHGGNVQEKTGQMSADDVNELMRLLESIKGFPSHPTKDVYGLNVRLEAHTMVAQWANAEEDPSADTVNEIAAETKSTFKDVVDSIEAAGRTFAKQDKAQ